MVWQPGCILGWWQTWANQEVRQQIESGALLSSLVLLSLWDCDAHVLGGLLSLDKLSWNVLRHSEMCVS